jgi:hypothetical protein
MAMSGDREKELAVVQAAGGYYCRDCGYRLMVDLDYLVEGYVLVQGFCNCPESDTGAWYKVPNKALLAERVWRR